MVSPVGRGFDSLQLHKKGSFKGAFFVELGESGTIFYFANAKALIPFAWRPSGTAVSLEGSLAPIRLYRVVFKKQYLICIFKLKQSFNLDSEYAGHLECKDG